MQSGASAQSSAPTDWVIDRPWAIALLALPLLVFLLSMRSDQPRTVVLGTARFFRPSDSAGGNQRARRLTLSRLLAILALVAGTIGLLGARPSKSGVARESFSVIVDRSPSMYLPVDPTDPKGATRMDRAVEALLGAFWSRAVVGEESTDQPEIDLVWMSGSAGAGSAPVVRALPDGPPPEFLTAPRIPRTEPQFSAFDEQGTVWVTDRRPEFEPKAAGLSASGGPAVPGPVSLTPEGARLWNGRKDGAMQLDASYPRPRVAVAATLNPMLAEFIGLWADARGVLRVTGAAELEVVGTVGEGEEEWSVVAGVPHRMQPGRMEIGGRESLELPEDPAAFAVAWARLLDRALLPSPGVVSLHERSMAGDRATIALPKKPLAVSADTAGAREGRARRTGRRIAAFLALAASLLGLAAAATRGRSL